MRGRECDGQEWEQGRLLIAVVQERNYGGLRAG